MADTPTPRTPDKVTIAVLKGGPEFQTWFHRLREQTRLPAALLLDASLVAYVKCIGFEEPPRVDPDLDPTIKLPRFHDHKGEERSNEGR
ncbi:hypothetical protein SAMN05444166_7315 [Singulisphaera sp. GP187]|nr:hypothetical protein SAMN05444166_7315 [Singulisphaera sp. GP187]